MTWHLEVDRKLCMGSGVCAGTAPGLFVLDGDHARPVRDEAEPAELVLDVADSCPVMAIVVKDGREVVGPRP